MSLTCGIRFEDVVSVFVFLFGLHLHFVLVKVQERGGGVGCLTRCRFFMLADHNYHVSDGECAHTDSIRLELVETLAKCPLPLGCSGT